MVLGRTAQIDDREVTHNYLADGLGSTMALTDEQAAVINAYEYDVFGSLRSASGSQANFFDFAGGQVDGSTNLQTLRARTIGQFLSSDPVSSRKRHGHGARRENECIDYTI